jgi:3-dehydroquinate synthase
MEDSPLSEAQTLEIASRLGGYRVVSAPSLAEAISSRSDQDKTWLIIDQAVLILHQATITQAFSAERLVSIPASESAKSYEQLGPVFERLLGSGFRRDCTLLAVGGGVVQDIAAFVAAVLVRGVRWEFIPTTLLAQCDSCIGAKSSINIGRFKNQLGCFHAPTVITVIPALLETLTGEAIRSGLGEIVKFHLLESVAAWQAVQRDLPEPSADALRQLIWTSLRIKRRYIEADEFDRGVRNLLNYGHTFGHAFESVSGFSIPHGIAVALGMAAATFISERRHLASPGHFQEVDRVLRPLYAPFNERLAAAPMASLLTAMRSDKKNIHGKTFVILTRGPGHMEKVQVDLESDIAPALGEFLAQGAA